MSKKEFLNKVNRTLRKEKIISHKLTKTVNQLDFNITKLQEQLNQLKPNKQ